MLGMSLELEFKYQRASGTIWEYVGNVFFSLNKEKILKEKTEYFWIFNEIFSKIFDLIFAKVLNNRFVLLEFRK